MASKHWEQNKDATVYVGNIDERFTQELLSELMTQVGPVRQVHMPQDRVSQTHQGYGFVEFDTSASADYAARVLNGIRIWGKPIRVNKASADKQKAVDIGAELFINNLDPQVDEKILYDTFSQFGGILRQPSIIRDDNHISKGYGFVSFDSFEASDVARDTMNGQYLLSKQITVEYAYKKDGKGERHGDEAERKLAAEGKKHNILPEQQTLPAAYHMTGPNALPVAGAPTGPAGPGGAVGAVAHGVSPPPHSAAMGRPHLGGMPPIAPAAAVPPVGPAGIPVPAYGIPHAPSPLGVGMPGRGMPPPLAFNGPPGPGGRGAMVLPPAPSGLPARPPPSSAGFGSPVVGDFFHQHAGAPPGFRGGIPPPQPGVVPPAYPGMAPPPPGTFSGAPNGVSVPPPGPLGPPGPPPPPGFLPPGFGPPHQGPPTGFVRH